MLEAYSRPTYEAAKKFPEEGFVEVASRVPEQPLPAAWEEDFGPRLEELLDLEAVSLAMSERPLRIGTNLANLAI